MKDSVDVITRALALYRAASQQGHSTHWDSTQQHGAGCPECKRAMRLRDRADELLPKTLLDQIKRLYE